MFFKVNVNHNSGNNLSFKVRVDRIDKIDNNYIILDYKTSLQNINSLVKAGLENNSTNNTSNLYQITDFQFPIYSNLQNNLKNNYKINGVVYAEITSENINYNGVGDCFCRVYFK